jgi:signal transduction histidine kinase
MEMMGRLVGALQRLGGFAPTSRRFFWSAAAVLAVAAAGYEVVIYFQVGGETAATAVDDLGSAVAALLAGIGCTGAAYRTAGRIRAGWLLIGISAFSWCAGEIAWSWLEVFLGRTVPSPSIADVGFIAAIPFAVAGLLFFAAAAGRRAQRARTLVDGLVMATALLFVSWEAVLRPIFSDSTQSLLGKLVNLAYPVADLVMFTIVIVALARVRSGSRFPIAVLGAGVVCLAVSDSAFAYLNAVMTYNTTALDGGWVAGYLLIALGSLAAKPDAERPAENRMTGVGSLAAPYLALVLALVEGALVVLRHGRIDVVGVWIAAGLGVFILLSQLLVIIDNRALLRQSLAGRQALVESQRTLTQVIASAPVVLFSIDADSIITLATGQALASFGDRAAHVAGRSVDEVLGHFPELVAAIEDAQAGRAGQLTVAFEHGDLDIRLLPVFEDGRVTSVSGVAIDVSERRASELARRESEAKSRFLATMSHELRTPLNSVLGFAELLLGQRRGPLNEHQRRYVSNIAASGQHLLTLINDVLDLSRVAAGELEIAIEQVSAGEAVADAVTKIRPLSDRKRQQLRAGPSGPQAVMADPVRLQQIVLNLLSNAVKFTPEGGRIEVRTEARDGFVQFEVKDSGIGIAPEHQERIFDEYSQVDDSYNRDQAGSGLGLAVSRRLAELMLGTLTVESKVGQGSVFRLRLPAPSVVPAEDSTGGGERDRSPERQAEDVAAEPAQA